MNADQITSIIWAYLDFYTGKQHNPDWSNFPPDGIERVKAWAKWYAEKHPEPSFPVSEREKQVAIAYRNWSIVNHHNLSLPDSNWKRFTKSDKYRSIPPASNELREKIEARINEIHLNPLPDGWTIREANRIIRELENLLKPTK
jgi:hypothetical protein